MSCVYDQWLEPSDRRFKVELRYARRVWDEWAF